MKQWLFAAALTVFIAGCGQLMEVTMNAQNNSGESGTTTLTQKDDGVEVVISINKGLDTNAQAAHIHESQCETLGDIKYPLSNVVDGGSVTLITGLKLDELRGGKYAVNVHHSNGQVYVSCGNIK